MRQTVQSKEKVMLKSKLDMMMQEHNELKTQVKELSSKTIMTPEDEHRLRQLRKRKLNKKDMIAYLASILKEED